MRIVDAGSGPAVVLVPGIQGRWEWMKPAVDALSSTCRVITFSLADEPTCGGSFDAAHGFACYVQQIAHALDAAGVRRAAICGVSYGGLIAAAFAARHPERVTSVILVSAVPPAWPLNRRIRFYLRAPVLLSPLFCLGSLRMYREIAAAAPDRRRALASAARHGANVLTHMFSPRRMARRAQLTGAAPGVEELQRVRVPALVMTGEAALDRVVPVDATRQYLRIWPHAESVTLARTGHLGLITRADEFASIVTSFASRAARAGTCEEKVG